MLTKGDVETHSFAMFSSPMGETAIVVHQGETINYTFSVRASECGDINLNMASLLVFDREEDQFVEDVIAAEIPMSLTNTTDGVTYSPAATTTTHTSSNGVVYTWYDCAAGVGEAYDCNMETLPIAAGEEKWFTFSFTATDYIPAGITVTVGVDMPMWTDVVSDTLVWDTSVNITRGTQMYVTVIE